MAEDWLETGDGGHRNRNRNRNQAPSQSRTHLRRGYQHPDRLLVLQINHHLVLPLFHAAGDARLELVMDLLYFFGGRETLACQIPTCVGTGVGGAGIGVDQLRWWWGRGLGREVGGTFVEKLAEG